jgi:cytochrome b subunit of formate dehydrogenase
MRFNNWSKLVFILVALAITGLAISFFRTPVTAQMDLPETKQAETVVLRGRIVDLTCAVNGKIMTGTWNNVAADHMMADGNILTGCGTMCLKGGQPAALFF